MLRSKHKHKPEAELDITSFMNLMIVLVPVLLLSMVFAHITVLDLKLPDLAADPASSPDTPDQYSLEVVIYPEGFVINQPAGRRLRSIPATDEGQDYKNLSVTLQAIKQRLEEIGNEKRDIVVLSQKDTDYQTLVSVMDTVRSFKAVVAANEVDASLFPDVSLGDAPVNINFDATPVAEAGGVTP
ncbi:biopolymer transporter ExbD [Simiduia curdlanivorans]|uniref:ExbD/TolR family protein n=1 Tax=Simiduia curdlanivorans TaxID=1492769 RepID=A0ABV8UZH1_9GAMM|nr:biopolymer transporter ExbD [Simiduia curdlanivorans]MDN3638066.1 biopolymer transporter ExbD [Simiduia curdlanivorans]